LTAPVAILQFWFGEPGSAVRGTFRKEWFAKDPAFDTIIWQRFGTDVEQAIAGAFVDWETDRDASLALILLLDQLPRNIYRGDARAYSGDARARSVANEALVQRFDRNRPAPERQFFYMPFMHGEQLPDQDRSLALFLGLGNADSTDYAVRHRDIIKRFGRFPHRNKVLGRRSTPEEEKFLKEPGSSF